jgi:hypothetical protein
MDHRDRSIGSRTRGKEPPGDSDEHHERDHAGGSPPSSIRCDGTRRTWRRLRCQSSQCVFDLDPHVSDVLPPALPILF